MNFKHLALLGAAALVVFGCVLAAGCTSTEQTPAVTPLSSAAGEWYCPECTDGNGNTVTAIQTIKADGTGYWMQLADDNPGIQIKRIYTSEFTAPDQNGAFDKVSSTGKTHKMVYDAAKDTITQDGRNVYVRADSLAGIWYGDSIYKEGTAVTNVIKNDGTGLTVTAYADGTAKVSKITWKKSENGSYVIDISNGNQRVFTVDADGKTLTTDDGRKKTKAFTDSTFLMSVTGPWYTNDMDRIMIFNADGTGTGKYKDEIFKFTWGLKDIGKFAVTYLDGTAKDGSSLKGKTLEWTYDRENDVFTSSNGTNYIRPTESVEGKIILS